MLFYREHFYFSDKLFSCSYTVFWSVGLTQGSAYRDAAADKTAYML